VRSSTDAERVSLHDTFEKLCRIESPSGRERACADWVSQELRGLGIEVQEDGAGSAAGSNAGNLLARIPGAGTRSVLLCAHLDTVPLAAPIEPVRVNDGWENANDGILGADNKTAVAIVLELARRTASATRPPAVGLELLFTVCEEVSLRGSREFDVGCLTSQYGYVFDHATPVGGIVVASTTHHRILAEFRGRAAHAGLRPEAGRSAIVAAARAVSAMRLGRLDEETTANVGTISGGSAINVVPERCTLEAEVRSLDEDRAEAVATEVIDHLQDAANASECDLDVTVERMFKGYRTRPRAPHVLVAERALAACGYEPRHIVSGGASDVNSMQDAGFPCLNLADGTERNHEPGERVSFAALEGMFEVAGALLVEAGTEAA
jgi:tripeptide aminopeptidase